MNYPYILFDLDGTLTDPRIGITKSVQYALKRFDIEEPNLLKLNTFIGPPLADSFAKYYEFNESQATQAITYFREYFGIKGILENTIYEGIRQLLSDLQQAGCKLSLATSKPTIYATQILQHFEIDGFFDAIVGSNLDNTRTDKAEIIAHACSELNVNDLRKVLMVGDRKYDIAGAQSYDITSIGVQYGYGSEQELARQGPTYIVASVSELGELLTKLIK